MRVHCGVTGFARPGHSPGHYIRGCTMGSRDFLEIQPRNHQAAQSHCIWKSHGLYSDINTQDTHKLWELLRATKPLNSSDTQESQQLLRNP